MKKGIDLFEIEKKTYNFLISAMPKMIPKSFQKWLATYYPDARIRKKYLQCLGVEMGEGSYANLGFMVIPNNSSKKMLFIGKNVSIAPNVVCICESNANNGKEINTYSYVKDVLTKAEEIHIEDEAWIGANVTILPGVTIGRSSIIGAGSVVTKNVEPYSIYAGVPARKIRDIRTGEKIDGYL